MGLEVASYISQLVLTNPVAGDLYSTTDDHLRLIKTVLQTQFPSLSTVAVTATGTELNYVAGVTSAIQTQINTKGAITGQAWTGTHTFVTQGAGDNSTKAATTAYVATAISGISGTGTVTSVALSGGTTGLTVTGSPITSSGTLTLAGTLAVANGGTGAATLTANYVLLGNGTSALQMIAPGSSGNVLMSNGTTWASSVNTSTSVSGITSASASNTTTNADYEQTWRWALTTAAKSAFTFTESAASTNGATSQFLVDIQTVAASTAYPLRVAARGSDVISVTSAGAINITAANSTVTGKDVTLISGNGLSNGTGGTSTLQGGQGQGSGAGGAISINSGSAGTTGNGGSVTITARDGGATSGNGGSITLTVGAVTSGTAGNLRIVNLPTASAGLPSGAIWLNSNVLTIVP